MKNYRYIYLSEAKEYGTINLDILKEAAAVVAEQDLKKLLASNPDVMKASGLQPNSSLDNIHIMSVVPKGAAKVEDITGFTVSIPAEDGQARTVEYKVDRDAYGKNAITRDYTNDPAYQTLTSQIMDMLKASDLNNAQKLASARITNILPSNAGTIENVSSFLVVYPQNSGTIEEDQYRADRSSGQLIFLPMGTLVNTIKNMLLQTIPDTDPKKKAMADTGNITDIQPDNAVSLPQVTGFKVEYIYNGGIYEPEYQVGRTSRNKIVFTPVDNRTVADQVLDIYLQHLTSTNAPEGNAVAGTGKVSEIVPENAQTPAQVKTFTLTYSDEVGENHIESYNITTDPSGKVMFQRNESLENQLMQYLNSKFSNDAAMTNWLANGTVSDIQPVQNTEGKTVNEVASFTVTNGDRVETFVQTQQDGKVFFTMNSVEDDLYRYVNSIQGMESISPQNSTITVTDPPMNPSIQFKDVNKFILAMNDGTSKLEFKASNQPGKPKAFTVQKLASADLNSELQASLAGTPIAKAYPHGYVVKDVRPGNAGDLGDVRYFMVSDASGNSMQYFGMKNGKPELLELSDMIRLYATSPESGLQYYKTPAAVTGISNISQDKNAGNTLDSVKGFTLTLENKEAIPMVAGKDSSGVLRFRPIDAKEGDSTAPGQGLTITDKDKKRIEQIVNKTLDKMGNLQFAGWTNFRER